jgi:L,D-transpeptidase ErfK/SrfK
LPVPALVLVATLHGISASSQTPDAIGDPLGDQLVAADVDYLVAAGETFESIGERLGVDPIVIARRNVKWVRATLPAGTKLSIEGYRAVPSAIAIGLAINIPQRLLFVRNRAGALLAMPIGAGRPTWPTPLGEFIVVRKETDPTWDVPLSIQAEMAAQGRAPTASVPPGPQNPLGKFWIGLSFPAIGIHGTNAPSSVPGLTTHGCIRVRPAQIEQLFELASIGMRGVVVYQPLLLVVDGSRIFLEVNRDAYGRHPQLDVELEEAVARAGVGPRIDWARAFEVVRRREGIAVEVGIK